jgi:T5SS/PEP-CTERM-associated repeat protein
MRAMILSRLVRPLALTLTILLIAAGASAQLVSDGATATINGTATNIAGFLIIGNTGPNTTLIVTNGGSVTSGSIGIGGNTSSTNNLVAVSGVGSQMTTPGGGSVFRIGDGSAFNRLLISEGGAVTTGYGVVGYPVGASNNSVLVAGSGSAWTNDFLFIGEGGTSNSVTVANGGQVQSFGSIIGVVASASNNWVSVTGTNSLWTTASTLNIGGAGEGSRLQVSSNGTVIAATMTLGDQVTSSNNVLSIAAGNVMVTNASGTGVLDVRWGKVEFTGGNLIADELLVTMISSANSSSIAARSSPARPRCSVDSSWIVAPPARRARRLPIPSASPFPRYRPQHSLRPRSMFPICSEL